jgi:hypothetical protein
MLPIGPVLVDDEHAQLQFGGQTWLARKVLPARARSSSKMNGGSRKTR